MNYRRCKCPVWVLGTLAGRPLRKSLDTVNWQIAEERVLELESDRKTAKVSVKDACERFYVDCKARGLGAAQLGKYKLLTDELKNAFAGRNIGSISVDDLRAYREGWSVAPVTAGKKLDRLRTFFRFCEESGWISSNPAKLLKAPKVKQSPTLPYSKTEIEKIVWATEIYPDKPKGRRAEVRAFVKLLMYSGLRIGDAVTLKKEKISEDGNLMLYSHKTGVPVFVPLPGELIEELSTIRPGSSYFFWSGAGLAKSGISDWQRSLTRLFKLAGVEGAHAHRFRDYFSVRLLENGVPLQSVAALLGNSLKVAEKHYSPWVQSRQEGLVEAVKKVWASK
jgi:integrase